jgi:hypothetical protein
MSTLNTPANLTPSDSPTHADGLTPAPLEGPPWYAPFLVALADSPHVTAAALAAGVTRQHAYFCKKNDPGFAQAWKKAMKESTDALEAEARRRAKEGTRSYKFHPKTGKPLLFPAGHPEAGKPYYEHSYSDTLMLALLKAHKPKKYRERSSVDMKATVRPAAPALDFSNMTDQEKDDFEALLRKSLNKAA